MADTQTLPNYSYTTDKDYGRPKKEQHPPLQELTKPHTDSFNYMLREGLTKAVQNIEPVEFVLPNDDKIALFIRDATVFSPAVVQTNIHATSLKVYPAECRERGVTYKGRLLVNLVWQVNGQVMGNTERVIGEVPIMVKSEICNLHKLGPAELIRRGEETEEMGGYFIVNGIERIIRMLIMPRRNFPMCIVRPSWKNRGNQYTEFGISLRCVTEDQSGANHVLHYLSNGTASLSFTYQKEQFFVPVVFILKGLLKVTDKHIYNQLIAGREDDSFYRGCVIFMLRQALDEGLTNQKTVLKHIGERFRPKLRKPEWYSDEDLGRHLFRHCVCFHLHSNVEKFNLLVYMTQKLFVFAKGGCATESADNPMNQEVLLGGHLYLMVLKEKIESWLHSLRTSIERTAKGKGTALDVNLGTISDACRHGLEVTKPMEYLMATGNLVSRTGLGLMQATGLTVVADKLNFMRYISHFRCIHRGAFFAQMRTTAVRKLLPEAWGFLCPVHTPDGTPCGLMNHMSALCQIVNIQFRVAHLPRVLVALGICPFDGPLPAPVKECYTVLLDGKVCGYVPDEHAQDLERRLRVMKVQGQEKIPPLIEICLVPKTKVASQYPGLYIFTGLARMMRPVTNLALNKVEMIGTFEQVYMNIAIVPEEMEVAVTTHQELNEQSMLSAVASFTPFSDFNQSPRNMYQCQMGKQTMGTPLHAFTHRADNKLYRILFPQTPMVRPIIYDQYKVDNYPLGTNAIVAVISYTGYDMEDAMCLNKASYERGFAHGVIYKSEFIDLNGKVSLVFGCKPGEKGSDRLNEDGLPPVGIYLEEGDPYYSYINIQTGECRVVKYKHQEPAYVEQIKILANDSGTTELQKVCIVLRMPRNPIIGDKFASRHGQKGICSMKWPVENMPFTESGMVPDIIFNPHGFPSRMTIGMMIESMAGKSGACHGLCHDATPFQFSEEHPAIHYFGDLLTAAGYNYYGTERLYSGIDGREFEADIFIGVVYYQRLRHMVSDKFQVRTTGPIDNLTHQPVKGRKRAGGIRFGEMERDGLIAHGTAFLLQDRLLNCSDRSQVHLCTRCGSILSPTMEKPVSSSAVASYEMTRHWKCGVCESREHIELITVPYVFRYLVAELAAMNIKVELEVT
ncbi:LOW QUALITY PROTEIN: DNA-directed RNA polymerase I subunit RPA2-like [Liolophura sinensis]|uniref:LOW QUALITY PROTEIN: DNA-directed RNA polymerase I subunit RPA2-like n=1 Tax=Liolophura sinensis TaxID=3198878 RepID=UPI0031584E35